MSGSESRTETEVPQTGDADRSGDQPARPRPLSPAAERALAEAAERRAAYEAKREELARQREIDGRGGLDPVRYDDWEVKGIASDFS